MALLLLAACEKVSIDDLNKEDPEERNDGVKLTFRVMSFEQTRFNDPTTVTRAAVRDVCDKINLALYDMENNRLKAVNQKADDENFGSMSLSIEPGTYRVLILAHSCSGNATTTNIEKITFPDNKVTDTFYYCAEIEVDDQKTYDVELRRVVAMFKLVVADEIPSDVKKMKFYYTGGSSTLNGLTGYGCVNSKQTEIRNVGSTAKGQEFCAYTFLHGEEGTLKMTVTAQDAADGTVKEMLFTDVPMRRNTISQFTGSLFTGGSSGQTTFALTLGQVLARRARVLRPTRIEGLGS